MSKCAWCDMEGTVDLELEPAVWSRQKSSVTGKTIKILRKSANVVRVCSDHYYSLERSDAKANRR